MSASDHVPSDLGSGTAALAQKWKWIVAVGVVLMLCGLVALGSVVAATVASVLVVGAMMLVAGIYEIIHAFAMKSWSRFALWILLGVFYTIAGIATAVNPLLAAGVLTLLLGTGLVASGILRIVLGVEMRDRPSWGMVVLSGVITTLLGGMILFQWPTSSFYTLGIFLGLDLMFAGASWFAVGLALRRRRMHPNSTV